MRLAAGAALVAAAAVIAFAAGGSSLFGGLGSLYGRGQTGLEVAKVVDGPAAAKDAAIVAAPSLAQRGAAVRDATRQRGPGSTRGHGRRDHGRSPAGPRTSPPASQPAPPPSSGAPPAPPTGPPAPQPGGGQAVNTVAQAVKQVTSKAPPPAQPITKPVDDVVDTLVNACASLPVCP